MTLKLNSDLTAAVDANGEQPLEVVHPTSNCTYYIVKGDTYRQAMKALGQQRRQDDHDAIAEGIQQMEAGEGIPVEDARALTRERLGLGIQ